MALELELQYCQACIDKIKSIEDMNAGGLNVKVIDGAFFKEPNSKIENADVDVKKSTISWYPLLVISDDPHFQQSQRFHD